MSNIQEINKRLLKYGTNLLGKPHFRLVFSDDIFEKRFGLFGDYYGSILVREVKEVREVRKYNYISHRWILEMWKKDFERPTKELVAPDGYECIYVFEDKDGKELPVVWHVIEMIIFFILNPQLDTVQIKQAIDNNENVDFEKEVAYFEQMFSDSISYDLNKFHFKDKILLPGKDFNIN